MTQRYRLYGVHGSTYAAKLRALLRYRRLPFDWFPASFDWVPGFDSTRPELVHVQPRIIPVLWFTHDNSYRVDSTAIAYELESLHVDRSVIPGNRAQFPHQRPLLSGQRTFTRKTAAIRHQGPENATSLSAHSRRHSTHACMPVLGGSTVFGSGSALARRIVCRAAGYWLNRHSLRCRTPLFWRHGRPAAVKGRNDRP
jgi:hypothetical protein